MIVYEHNHVFFVRDDLTEGMQERLAPNDWLKTWTHAEVVAGADSIVVHAAPVLHRVEIFKSRPIFYDPGNFIYNVPPVLTEIDEPMTWESVVANVQYHGETCSRFRSDRLF